MIAKGSPNWQPLTKMSSMKIMRRHCSISTDSKQKDQEYTPQGRVRNSKGTIWDRFCQGMLTQQREEEFLRMKIGRRWGLSSNKSIDSRIYREHRAHSPKKQAILLKHLQSGQRVKLSRLRHCNKCIDSIPLRSQHLQNSLKTKRRKLYASTARSRDRCSRKQFPKATFIWRKIRNKECYPKCKRG